MGFIKTILVIVLFLFLLVALFYPEETREMAKSVGMVVLGFGEERVSDIKEGVSEKVSDVIGGG